jgi:hypothetical protein
VRKIKNRPKVIHLFDNDSLDKDETVANLENLIAEVRAGNVKNYAIAAELNDGTVATGWTNANVIERQTLISHLQIDILWQVVKTNLLDELDV